MAYCTLGRKILIAFMEKIKKEEDLKKEIIRLKEKVSSLRIRNSWIKKENDLFIITDS
jgi:hypothetical protein